MSAQSNPMSDGQCLAIVFCIMLLVAFLVWCDFGDLRAKREAHDDMVSKSFKRTEAQQ